jgi:hypothetical protein
MTYLIISDTVMYCPLPKECCGENTAGTHLFSEIAITQHKIHSEALPTFINNT